MNIKALFTDETTIKITVLKIDNKKLTKGVFNQLHINSPFDKLYNLKENVKFLGYINDKTRWLIWTNSDFIYKYEIKNFYPLLRLDFENQKIQELIKIYPSEQVEALYSFHTVNGYEYRDLQISSVLDVKEQREIIDRKESLDEVIKAVLKKQIFL